jgi:3-oxoadipate enol-lactonase
LQHSTIDVPGQRAPALVFAHGLGGNHLSWVAAGGAFRDALHLRGIRAPRLHAVDSGKREHGPRFLCDDLAALIDKLGLQEVRLVAQSMGRWTCLDYALRFPAKVRALVMACTSGRDRSGSVAGVRRGRICRLDQAAGKPLRTWKQRGFLAAAANAWRASSRRWRRSTGRSTSSRPAISGSRCASASARCAPSRDAARAAADARAVPERRRETACFRPGRAGPRASRAEGPHVSVPRPAIRVYFERAAEFNRIVEEFLT